MNSHFFSLSLMGLIQGLTEFLPVSSSGHLGLMERFLPNSGGLQVEIFLHAATLFAILWFYRDDLKKLFHEKSKGKDFLIMIIIASIPTAIIGLFMKHAVEKYHTNFLILGIGWLFTTFFLFRMMKTPRDKSSLTPAKALWIGVIQGFAVWPGISRSGSTISTAVRLGISPEEAARFSFLMSVPAILGANVLSLFSSHPVENGPGILPLSLGFLIAFISGLYALHFLTKLLSHQSFYKFFLYTFPLGLFFTLLGILRISF